MASEPNQQRASDIAFQERIVGAEEAPREPMRCQCCGIEGYMVNPMDVAYFDENTFICSRACWQKALDEKGATLHFPDGTQFAVPPGKLTITGEAEEPCLVVGERPQTIISIQPIE